MNNLAFNDDEIFSYLEYEEYSEFKEWYLFEGSSQVKELSRQLRTFLNYRSSVIRGKLCNFQSMKTNYEIDKISHHRKELTNLSLRYVILLNNELKEEKSVKKKLQYLMNKASNSLNVREINLLKEIRYLNQKIWILLHLLSEYDLSFNYPFLTQIIKIASICSSATSVFFHRLSQYYIEIEQGYSLMEKELVQEKKEPQIVSTKLKEKELLR